MMPLEIVPPTTPLTFHWTVGGSPTTVARSCTLVPATMCDGAPEIATEAVAPEVESVTVAAAGSRGNPLLASAAVYWKESGPA